MNKKEKERLVIKNMFGGKCAYCGTTLNAGWHIDHVHSKFYEEIKPVDMRIDVESISNKFPACAQCNIAKRAYSIEEFRKVIFRFRDNLNKTNANYRNCLRFGIIKENNSAIQFWFEKYLGLV